MKAFISKYWPLIVHLATGALSFALPSITAYVAAHPGTALGAFLVWAQYMHLKTSPLAIPGSKF